jgi:anti-anti-sigma factor
VTARRPEAILTEKSHHDTSDHVTSSAPLLTASKQVRGAVVILSLAGEIDMTSQAALREALDDCAATPGIQLLICDLTDVTFMAVAGLTALLRIREILARGGARLRVVAQQPTVVMLFNLTGLAGPLGLCEGVAEAAADLE